VTEPLVDLLRRTADAVPDPGVDVDALLARAATRQRRRRLAAATGAAALVGVVAVGALAVRGDEPRHEEPAPPPSPHVEAPVTARPLVYAEGRTVHVGERTVEAEADVQFVAVTDDGVVFVTEDSDEWEWSERLWFDDGETTEAIGRVPTQHIGLFEVFTSDPGSIVVWADGTHTAGYSPERFVVYDTARHATVALLPYRGDFNSVVHVDAQHVYFTPDLGPTVLRYDLASGRTRTTSHAALGRELRSEPRQLPRGRFVQQGSRLVPVDADGEPVVVRGASGSVSGLRVPAGWAAPPGEIHVAQWLDDHRLVLFADDGGGDIPGVPGDFLTCDLRDQRCRLAVPLTRTPYIAPGQPS